MSDQPSGTAPGSISVDQLTEAVASGVLRALSSPTFAKENPVDVAQLAAERGIWFAQEGTAACLRCLQVVTQDANPSPAMALAANPLVPDAP